jgi:hypothetical protein
MSSDPPVPTANDLNVERIISGVRIENPFAGISPDIL